MCGFCASNMQLRNNPDKIIIKTGVMGRADWEMGECMAEIIKNDNTSIYVIDEGYHLVYFNQVLQKKYPQAKTGEFCYERLCGERQPCQVCPLARKKGSESLYYNRLMRCWINIGTGELDWPDKGRCHIVLATSIHEEDAMYEELLNPLTGLYKRAAFFQKGEEFLDEAARGRYCLAAIDIEHFKLFNDWYGQKAGDKLLADIGKRLLQLQQEGKGVAGYIGGDDFVVLLPNDAGEIREIQRCITEYVKAYGENAGFLPTFGIYEIEEREHSLSAMYDRAVIAANSIKGNYAQRISYYDRRMKQRMDEDHLLLSEVQRGLENGEFVFYTQPKCSLSTGRIVGLEALVRWNHSTRGVISPGTFLPLLESNGLITNLDMFIWESVCKKVRSWIDQGRRPIPISVNVSFVDIFAIDVVETFRQLTSRYDLEPRLIEIEITESAYVERFDEVIRIVEALRAAGFTVLMDDFGSGYSSLNMLKDVSVDILKIDMKFLDLNENSLGRGVSILEAIARMAHIMGLKLIAEGVETKEQVEFLLNVGCSYGQGYYFHRPMAPEDMEALIADEGKVDYRGITLQQMEPVRMRDLFNEDVISDTMAGNILGAAAFYDVHDGGLELLRANERYCAVVRTNMTDLAEGRREILQEVHPEDQGILRGLFRAARENQTKGAEGEVRRRTDSGAYIWVRMRIFFLREQGGHRIYYGSLTDVTDRKKQEDQLESFRRALASVVNISDDDQSFMKLTEENRRAAATIAAQMSPGGMIGGYCEPGFPLYFANYEMVRLLGYDTYEEFAEAIGQNVENTIHPDDRARVARDIGPEYYQGLEYVTTYRMPRKDGTWFWTLDKGKVIRAEDGRLAIASACTDISEAVEAHRQLFERDSLHMWRRRVCSDITDIEQREQELLLNSQKMESVLNQAGINSWEWDFKENTLKITGSSALFPVVRSRWFKKEKGRMVLENFTDIIDDETYVPRKYREVLRDYLERVKSNLPGNSIHCEFPMEGETGRVIWLTAACETLRDEYGVPVQAVGYYRNISEERRQVQHLTQMAETDALTGLLNRQAAVPRIEEYIRSIGDSTAALVMFDLDNFKQANDVFGHSFGDLVIVENARKLKQFFRRDDIICRIGGDEFLILCRDIREKDLVRKLRKVIGAMETVHEREGQSVRFSASAGYVMIPEQGTEFDELYGRTDVALFAAKLQGKGAFCKYSSDMKTVRSELKRELLS